MMYGLCITVLCVEGIVILSPAIVIYGAPFVWKWGEHKLPKVSSYAYLGIDFACNGAWDVHLKRVLDNGRKKVNQLHSIISNRDIDLSARRLLLLSVIRPSCRAH